ncbi:AAA family ATPase [Granulosicoccus sp. 3-233]|uniref:AAA family ATPase n=1 Tax=Granulosicoccus sp. 3-233 TaxID=3417969 RepID=UPI003D32D7F5
MSRGTLYVFCGKMASGKSTLARQIAAERASTMLSEDHLLAALYAGEVNDVSSYVRCSDKLKSAIRPVLIDLLRNGASVVLDFPANTVTQRRWIQDVIVQAGASHEFHYLHSSDESCKARLKARAIEEPQRHATDTVAMFDAITRFFEPPSNDEGFDIIRHDCG